jgi:hypothetical protein
MHREHERCKAEYAGNESIKFLKGNGLLPENLAPKARNIIARGKRKARRPWLTNKNRDEP